MAKLAPPAWKKLRPHPVQSALWRCDKRFITVAAGRGSGKTELALRKLAMCSRINNGRYLYAGPTIQQAKSVAWDRLVELVPPQWLAQNSPNRSELTIRTIFNCEIRVAGLDKPHRIEGVQYNGGVLDESADIRPGAFQKSILPALSEHRGWFWRIGVPKRVGVGVIEYKKAFDEGLEDNSSFTWPSADIYSEEIINEARSKLDEITFREQFEASWECAAGGIYHAFSPEWNVRDNNYCSERELVVGSDFNVDPMCWCIGHIFGNELHIFDEIKLRSTNTPATLNHLYQKYGQHENGWAFYGDASGRNRSTKASMSDYQIIANDDRFKRKKVRYPAANPPRADRFAATNALLRNAKGETRVFIDPRCTNLLNDLSQRSYKEGTSEPDDAADIGHMADAFDYIIYANWPVGWESILKCYPKVGF